MSTLRILTFNTWLLRTPLGFDLAKDIDERFSRLPAALAATDADVLCLQEVWSPWLRRTLAEQMLRRGFPFAAGVVPDLRPRGWGPLRFSRGFFGNGLMVLSRFPIVGTRPSLDFRAYTRPDEIFVQKGAIGVEIEVGSGNRVLVCNSHLGAVSFSPGQGTYHKKHLQRRLHQSRELVSWLAGLGHALPVFLAVDLNVHTRAWSRGEHSERLSREVALLLGERLKKFSFAEASLELRAHHPIPQWTFHSGNPYVASGFFGHLPNEVTDYLFYRPVQGWGAHRVQRVFVPERMPELLPGIEPLSDHYGVLAEFRR